jgi:hypothetical protein
MVFVKKQRQYDVKTKADIEKNGLVLMLTFEPYNFLRLQLFVSDPVPKYLVCKNISFDKIPVVLKLQRKNGKMKRSNP